MNKEKLYIVTMYRFADREKHSYVLGVFSESDIAKEEAEKEKIYRGSNKYFPEILEFNINDITSKKVFLKLEE